MAEENKSMTPKDWEALKAVALYKVIQECGDEFVINEPELAAMYMRFYLLGFKAGSPNELFDNIDFE